MPVIHAKRTQTSIDRPSPSANSTHRPHNGFTRSRNGTCDRGSRHRNTWFDLGKAQFRQRRSGRDAHRSGPPRRLNPEDGNGTGTNATVRNHFFHHGQVQRRGRFYLGLLSGRDINRQIRDSDCASVLTVSQRRLDWQPRSFCIRDYYACESYDDLQW